MLNYTDETQHVADITWYVTFIGKNSGDNLLEQDEQAKITVDLSGTIPPGPYEAFTVVVKPVTGAALVLERVLPARIDPVMDLH